MKAIRARCKMNLVYISIAWSGQLISHQQDVFAILLAAHHPSLNLLGISTVHGNASLENTTANATRVLEAIGRSDIAVYPGSRKPFCRAVVHAPDIHGVYFKPF